MAFLIQSGWASSGGILDLLTANLKIDEGTAPPLLMSSPSPIHPAPTNQIVQVNQDIHCHFDWTAQGWLYTLFSTPLPTANWYCTVYVERLGGVGEGPVFGPIATPFSGTGIYSTVPPIIIPAGTLSVGVYKIVCTITAKHNSGTPLPVAAFDEGMYIQVYQTV